MGDIGCLGTKSNGQDAYHVFVGGGFGKHQSIGRQIFAGVTATELANTVEKLLNVYLNHRRGPETLRSFPRVTKSADCSNCLLKFEAAGKSCLSTWRPAVPRSGVLCVSFRLRKFELRPRANTLPIVGYLQVLQISFAGQQKNCRFPGALLIL
jgi:hypothetical protein